MSDSSANGVRFSLTCCCLRAPLEVAGAPSAPSAPPGGDCAATFDTGLRTARGGVRHGQGRAECVKTAKCDRVRNHTRPASASLEPVSRAIAFTSQRVASGGWRKREVGKGIPGYERLREMRDHCRSRAHLILSGALATAHPAPGAPARWRPPRTPAAAARAGQPDCVPKGSPLLRKPQTLLTQKARTTFGSRHEHVSSSSAINPVQKGGHMRTVAVHPPPARCRAAPPHRGVEAVSPQGAQQRGVDGGERGPRGGQRNRE
eukprot:1193122-Prorocentrum_minimum.AAC.3